MQKLNIACKQLELYETSKIQRNILYLMLCCHGITVK